MRSNHQTLSRRERQIMDVIYRKRKATAPEVVEALPDAVSADSVRKLIRILEQKGHLVHQRRGRKHVYEPSVPRSVASRSAAEHLLETFFEGSVSKAVAALLNVSRDRLSEDDVEELSNLIEEAAQEGR